MPISHFGLAAPDLVAAKAYYEDLSPIIGFYMAGSRDLSFYFRPLGGPGVPVFIYTAVEEGEYSPKRTGLRDLSFIVRSRSEVERAHEWAIGKESVILQEPREVTSNGRNEYATSWQDPHGFPLTVTKIFDREESDAFTGGRGYGVGRLSLNVPGLEAAKKYFDELMPMVDYEPFEALDSTGGDFFSYRPVDGVGIRAFFHPAEEEGAYSRKRKGFQHAAFMVSSQDVVHRLHEWARDRGDEIVREPKDFTQYVHRPGGSHYAVFWHDPHGFMWEAVCHRSMSS